MAADDLTSTTGELERLRAEVARLSEDLGASRQREAALQTQLTATADVLRVIAASPTDLDQVLTALVTSVARLTESDGASIMHVEGDDVVFIASTNQSIVGTRLPFEGTVTGQALREARTVHIHGTPEEQREHFPNTDTRMGAQAATPLMHQGRPLGTLNLVRTDVWPFTDRQIALLETFADQAAIAIANARLFQDLQESNRQVTEALEQQTVTGEVLRVIASSPTDVRSVLDTLIASAARLCGAESGTLHQWDGHRIDSIAYWPENFQSEVESRRPKDQPGPPMSWQSFSGRVFLSRQSLHVPDVEAAVLTEFPDSRPTVAWVRHKSLISTPLMSKGEPIGIMALHRHSAAIPFTDQQIALLETFASQAVIAIENARLFQELEERTGQLTRSVDEQRALAEVSQTVSSSLDLQQVLTTIVTHATRLAEADAGTIFELDEAAGEFVHRVSYGLSDELIVAIQHSRPRLDGDHGIGRAARTGIADQSTDLVSTPTIVAPAVLDGLIRAGIRSNIAVPLVREQRVVGMLVVRRKATGAFPQPVVDLLQTFASQSVLAIENARLFQQVEAQSRELAIASQHKSEFLANMSHELRTPLNAVIGYSEMLQEEAEDLGETAFLPDLQRINAAGKHLLGLINDILDLSKIEAGHMDLYLETFDVAELVQDVASIVKPLVAKNGNTLVVSCPADLGAMHADLTKVRQTLFNLLSNASKFTDHGTIELRVARSQESGVRSQEHDPAGAMSAGAMNRAPTGSDPVGAQFIAPAGGVVTFAVSDTGIGMTGEQLGKLFEAFSQAEAGTSRRYGGTGLGLVISQHFCQMMGGDIAVESAAGVGSTFTVTLPADVARDEGRETQTIVSSTTQNPGASTSVALVVDDDPATRDVLARFLRAEGFRVLVADSGEEGLRLARQVHPALMTLDVLMPGMDGWAVLGALKSDPATADIPVVLLTILDDRDLGFALGATDYLTKPVDRERLMSLVRKYVPHDQQRRALVIDDDPATREMLRRLLERDGWTVGEAANGLAGLERVASAPFDLVLLDLMMPELDGFKFVERLRAEPAHRALPVLVVTSKDLTEEERRRLNGKVEKVILKGSYSRDALLAEVRQLVQASRAPADGPWENDR